MNFSPSWRKVNFIDDGFCFCRQEPFFFWEKVVNLFGNTAHYPHASEHMDEALTKRLHDLEGFYSFTEQAGYTISRGKNITFSHPRQKRNIRMCSLPEEYREDAIRVVLTGKRIHNSRKRRSPLIAQKA